MQYGVSAKTVCKWKSRDKFTNKSSRPKAITYALSDLEQSIAINLRRITWWALDEITEAINPLEPEKEVPFTGHLLGRGLIGCLKK